jgi:hypothetical protein
MRPSLRFLVLTLVAWGGIRAATAGMLPGAEVFKVTRASPSLPPIAPTQFPPIDPVAEVPPRPAPAGLIPAAAFSPASLAPEGTSVPTGAGRIVYVPVYATPSPAPTQLILPPARPLAGAVAARVPAVYASLPTFGDWPVSRPALSSLPPIGSGPQSQPQFGAPHVDARPLDRLQLSTWALLRSQQTGVAGSHSLAPEGQLGASQAGARLAYNFTRQISATFRTSSEVGRRGGEVAAGARIQPALAIPLWLTVERRQRIGRYGDGRSAFAMFLEGGIYQHPMPWRSSLDAYFQGGLVGLRSRDYFVDGALTLTRPVYRQFSAGFGIWGGAQPGLYRFDAGPRVTMRVRNNVRVHFDWRQRLAGNARPGSGPAITMAGDF